MVQERGAALGARGGCDVAVVVGVAVEEVFGIEDKAGLVLQELVADAGIAQESVGVHRVGHVAAVDEEVGNELKFPSLQFVAKGECSPVVVDVLPWLGGIAVGVVVPGEVLSKEQEEWAVGVLQIQLLGKVRAALTVIGDARGLVHQCHDSV